jgi:hypothetical protein
VCWSFLTKVQSIFGRIKLCKFSYIYLGKLVDDHLALPMESTFDEFTVYFLNKEKKHVLFSCNQNYVRLKASSVHLSGLQWNFSVYPLQWNFGVYFLNKEKKHINSVCMFSTGL